MRAVKQHRQRKYKNIHHTVMAGGILLPCHLLEDRENKPRIPAAVLCTVLRLFVQHKVNGPLLKHRNSERCAVALLRTEFAPDPLQLEISLNSGAQYSTPLHKHFGTMLPT